MNQLDQQAGATPAADADATPVPAPRVSFERLRERGDELELLISGLLAFSLLTLPSKLFATWAGNEVHAEGLFGYAQSLVALVGIGLGYALGFAFVAHLAIRCYWVGLIGLKSSFPDGIRWDRIPLPGPVSRAFYRRMGSDLGELINRVDRAASVVFSTNILCAIGIAWTGLLGLFMLGISALVGMFFADPEKAALIFFGASAVLAIVLTMAIRPLDRYAARLEAAGRPAPRMQRLIRVLLRMESVYAPLQLNAPVQLTLQSNLRNSGFTSLTMVVPMLALLAGGLQFVHSREFALFNPYRLITTEAVEHGMLSAHYESIRGPDDLLLRYPMIPAERIEARQLRLFIPHRPRRDNALARQSCVRLDRGRNLARGPAAADAATACMARLWSLRLDGRPLELAGFVPMERRDIGMRGLLGYIDLRELPPGRHDLALVWNPGGDDRGSERRREYRIPFWYDPQEG